MSGISLRLVPSERSSDVLPLGLRIKEAAHIQRMAPNTYLYVLE